MHISSRITAAALLTAAPALATTEPTTLEEVIVTAELRHTPLLLQSSSTSVVSARDIQQRAAQHLEDVLNVVPNVNFASGASRARFYQVRGIGERAQYQEPLNPSIGFIVDRIDFSGLGTVGTLFDVDQVEVLRGPQGTLHGANALAGLVNIRSNQPETEPALRMEASLAEYDTWSAGIVGTGPLVADELLYRIAVNTYQSDGFIENDHLNRDDTNDRDETSIRGKLRWLPGERDTVDITAMYVDIDNGYDAFSLDNTRHTLSDEPGHDRQESTAIGALWRHEGESLSVETAFSVANSESDYAYDEDWSYVGIAPGWEYSSVDQFQRERDSYSAEVRLLSNESSRLLADSTDWTTGIYYLGDREDLRRRYTYFYGNDFTSSYDTDTLALFGQLDTALSEKLTLITGLRLERRDTNYSDSNEVESDPSKDLWGGRIALEYQLREHSLMYANVSRGYRAHGVNASILASMDATDNPDAINLLERFQTFDDESLINYELGFKGSFAEGTVSTRAAAFYMDRNDQQVNSSLEVPRDDGSTAFIGYTSNAAEGNNYGLELEADWLATDNLTLYANLGLLETEFDEYITADGVDMSRRDQAHAPSYQYALGGRFNFGTGFYIRADFEGKDEFYASDSHNVEIPSQDLVHLRLGYEADNWNLALWGRNLTDEDYYVRGFYFPNDPRKEYITEPYYQFGEPRMIGVSASYTF